MREMGQDVETARSVGELREIAAVSQFGRLENLAAGLVRNIDRLFRLAEFASHLRSAEHRELIAGFRQALAEHWAELAELFARATTPAQTTDIRKNLAVLCASFPNAAKVDLRVFGAMLAIEVANKHPSAFAFAIACRNLRQRCRFLPTIAEILAEIETQENELSRTLRLITRVPELLSSVEERWMQEDQIDREIEARRAKKLERR